MLRRAPVILFTALSLGLTACESNLFEGGFSRFDEPVREAVTVGQSVDSYYGAAAERVAVKSARTKPGAAKNVILFIGDGMGVSTVTAARIHAGQLAGVDGESYQLAMETLPYAALVKTYSHDAQVSDSAATATAMVAGVKSPARTVGVTQTARFGNCNSGAGAGTDTIFELAENAGLATGVVSTARLTHATPASTFAESVDRNWENDTTIPMGATCKDIAQQFIDWSAGDHFEIALGGGRGHFLASTDIDPETDQPGLRADGKNLAAAWELKSEDHVTVYNRAGFEAALTDPDAKILGLFEPSHMQYELDRDESASGEPSIVDMTRAAIDRLSRHEEGYVLMVEAGRIDHAHHGTNAARALTDTVVFDQAVAAALEMTDPEETLIIVTADHSHTLTIQGYQPRNTPILGKVVGPFGSPLRLLDGKPYTTLSYANGGSACTPAEGKPCERADLTDVDTTDRNFRQQVLLPRASETHAGEDVPLFALGPGAEMLTGVIEQHDIFHVMGHATGLVE